MATPMEQRVPGSGRAVQINTPQQAYGDPQDASIDIERLTKDLLVGAASAVPIAGVLCGALAGQLLNALFPEGQPDPWEAIKGRVEELVKAKIDDAVWNLAKSDLQGVKNNFQDYYNVAKTITPESSGTALVEVRQRWGSAHSSVIGAYPRFQADTFRALLLPLFVQVANFYIALLRDMAIHGRKWGFEQSVVDERKTKLASILKDDGTIDDKDKFISYVRLNQEAEYTRLINQGYRTYWDAMTYDRESWTSTVETAVQIWPYMKITDRRVDIPQLHEVYLGPIGTTFNPRWYRPYKTPNEPLRAVWVWSWDRMDAIQCRFGDTWGPKRGTNGGSPDQRDAPDGAGGGRWRECPWYLDQCPADDYIDKVWAHWDTRRESGEGALVPNLREYGVHRFAFGTKSGKLTHWCGDHEPNVMHAVENWTIPGYQVTNFWVECANPAGNAAAVMVVGWRPVNGWKPQATHGNSYMLVSAENGYAVNLTYYSARDGVEMMAEAPAHILSQQWRLVSDDNGYCRLVNAYTSAHLAHDHSGRVFQTQDARRPDDVLWELVDGNDSCWALRAPAARGVLTLFGEHTIGLSPAVENNPAQWWRLHQIPMDTAAGSGASTGQATFGWEAGGATDHDVTIRISRVNPEGGNSERDWTLSFYLPPETQEIALANTDQFVLQATPEAHGTLVTITAADAPARDLMAAGTDLTINLTCRTFPGEDRSAAELTPIDIQLNGTRIS
ncbi:MAG: insecticidal delta-endotoxin Cry8Ea1 family protein [Actinomycetota bacterium]|nr:insecticidal delta-endotoxin Cry8Ea1 family protein [Actinomycetota bacterium]